jgi:hypothetical protein
MQAKRKRSCQSAEGGKALSSCSREAGDFSRVFRPAPPSDPLPDLWLRAPALRTPNLAPTQQRTANQHQRPRPAQPVIRSSVPPAKRPPPEEQAIRCESVAQGPSPENTQLSAHPTTHRQPAPAPRLVQPVIRLSVPPAKRPPPEEQAIRCESVNQWLRAPALRSPSLAPTQQCTANQHQRPDQCSR